MTHFFRIAAIVLVTVSCTLSVSAQSAGNISNKQALIKRMLKEKLHMPGTASEEHEQGMKTTSSTEGRVSTTPNTLGEGEISLAFNPTDSNKLVLSFMEQGSTGLTFPIYYSSDGGSNWTKSSFNSAAILSADYPGRIAAGGGDPVFAWDKNGTLYFGWIYLGISFTSDSALFTLNWAYSNDNGHTWNVKPKHFIGEGALDIFTQSILDFKDGVTDREWFAVDNSGGPHQGNLYCSYVCFPAGGAPTFMGVKTKLPGVDTFGPVTNVHTGDSQFGNLEVNKNGVVHMSFADIDNSKIRHTRSTDGGASFTPSVIVSTINSVFPDPPFIVHNRENGAVNLAVDGTAGSGNNVHIVWSDYPGTTINSFYSHSTDGGDSWSTPLNINTLIPGNITLMPTVSAQGSDVSISFTGVNANDTARYYQFTSTNNGTSFDMMRELSTQPCNYHALNAADTNSTLFFGDYNRSVRTKCQVYASWEDCRSNVNSKVYFSRANYCDVGVSEISLVNGDAQLLSLYPNPAHGSITVKMNAADRLNVILSITDLNGRTVLSHNDVLKKGITELSIPLDGLAKGVYVLAASDASGIIGTRSFVVQ